ncbi:MULTISPECIES: helix-turn-helix domain-containing protein [unclassified Fusibacter]|uniref:helix-turn-helix domain-containing protein n=1 Tax=unclassified Fusibacter TaxID=2624464 RepID=UPI0013E94860|nr:MULTISPECIES: helix-turn-helix transcriptional regulator [unclassified Fusibacter]MCK8059730.1 helix-turn-helix domain-containing protein [Fusibacter sp. A2]NPE21531.1 helix-turn-helix transcriptional regulator [Fusibacter sp. A1]
MILGKPIGEQIKKRREELSISQEELANRLGYKSRSSINKIEKGLTDVNQTKLRHFAEALSTTPDKLQGLELLNIDLGLFGTTTGKRLKELREESGYSIQFIASSLNIEARVYEQYENNSVEIENEHLYDIASFYDVSLEYIKTLTYNKNDGLKVNAKFNRIYNDLTEDEINKVIEYADFLRSQRK